MPFRNRADAGRQLAAQLARVRREDVVVLGLPRGGVPVAFEVAEAIGAPLDVIVVRKLGVPLQPELAMGAIGEDGVRVMNSAVLCAVGVEAQDIAMVERAERAELDRRVRRYRQGRPAVPLTGRTAVVVDDGMATGATAVAACRVARARGALVVVLAVPVIFPKALARVQADADEVVYLEAPRRIKAIGQCYLDFRQATDDEVNALLTSTAVSTR